MAFVGESPRLEGHQVLARSAHFRRRPAIRVKCRGGAWFITSRRIRTQPRRRYFWIVEHIDHAGAMQLVANPQHAIPGRVTTLLKRDHAEARQVVHDLGGIDVRVRTVILERAVELEFVEQL